MRAFGSSRLMLVLAASIVLLALAGCNNANRLYDSEIAAIDRQTKILHKQNCILERIAAALENKGGTK